MNARETFAMLEKESLWQTAARCHQILSDVGIPYLVVGGVAVCLHGYQRTTVDLDLLIRGPDAQRLREAFAQAAICWCESSSDFATESGIHVQLLLAGDRAGSGSEVEFPDPADAHAGASIEGLCVLSLARLIEAKIACGEGNIRRTHKDFADVVELIAKHQLDGAFARFLHKSVRATFRKLARNARGEV